MAQSLEILAKCGECGSDLEVSCLRLDDMSEAMTIEVARCECNDEETYQNGYDGAVSDSNNV